jgi:hypothetical protein
MRTEGSKRRQNANTVEQISVAEESQGLRRPQSQEAVNK